MDLTVSSLHKHFLFAVFMLIALLVSLLFSSQALAMVPVSDAQQLETIRQAFPQSTSIGDKAPLAEGKAAAWTVYNGEEVIGYGFDTNDVVNIPAYSGKPINTLIVMDTEGKLLATRVLEHHEPILLVGIPEQKLFDFVAKYEGLSVTDKVRVGAGNNKEVVNVDVVAGATVTVMVVNEAVMRSARKVAQILGIAGLSEQAKVLPATVKSDLFEKVDWTKLTGDGSFRRLMLVEGDVDKAFQ